MRSFFLTYILPALAWLALAPVSAALAPGYQDLVPESAQFSLVYSLDLPNDANYASAAPQYAIDTHRAVGSFDRIAYYVELQAAGGELRYVWVSMDPFTTDAGKIGVPTLTSGAVFQQSLGNLNVVSNVAGLATGTGMTGQIEFWPTNYEAANAANVPGASGVLCDLGDSRSAVGRYGSMQIHNTSAAQTVFAFNHWGDREPPGDAAEDIDIGIGNSTGVNPDWTFARNGAAETVKRIQVLVRRSGDLAAPVVTAARASAGRSQIVVEFDEPVLASSIAAAQFTLDQGVTVLGATVLEDARVVVLTTTAQPAAGALTLTLNGVRDTSPNANRIAPGTTVAVTAAALPAEIVTNVGTPASGYQLVYSYELPTVGDFNASRRSYRFDDSGAAGLFTRVAYYLELQQAGQTSRFVWASMDAFTASRAKLGIPTRASGAVYQRAVTNLQVVSNVPGVVTGSAIATGSIEFWPDNYSTANGAAIQGANASTYDFGDTRKIDDTFFGSMQLHNSGATQTVFAINHFGRDGNTLDLGMGNSTGAHPDWTFAANAHVYSKRILHVLVLPGATTGTDVSTKIPEAAGYQLAATINLPTQGNLSGGTGDPGYAFDFRNELGPFQRIAYYLELKKTADAQASYIWTSMDAFTREGSKIGVPNLNSGAFFQQKVSNLNVFSNVAGVVTGTGISTGNIEFWPGNCSEINDAGIPNASSTAFDFGDGNASASAGYGSMQVHNHGASQVLWAINNWGSRTSTTNPLCVGIGNQPTGKPDWTFANNAASYDATRTLRIYVLPAVENATPPTITQITPSTAGDAVAVTFSEPLADFSALPGNFSLDGGLTVTGARLSADKTGILLTTTPQTPGAAYTLTATGIFDRSPSATPLAGNTTVPFTAYLPPTALNAVAETAGYRLIYQLDLPVAAPAWNLNAVPYGVDQTQFGEFSFDRVAYLLALDSSWIYTSFDTFSSSIRQIGIPTQGVAASPFQQKVANLNVATNVPSVHASTELRTGLTGGNIEFWSGNYDAVNELGIPNASATALDWGDRMTPGSRGCFQVHDHGNSKVLFAINNWGSNQGSGQTVDVGIGSRSTGAPDWTLAANAASYTSRRLYVLARPKLTDPSGPAPLILSHPSSRSVRMGRSASLSVQVAGPEPVTYQWRFEGQNLTGETSPWLDLTHFSPAMAGAYDVVVTSAIGISTLSAPAQVSLRATDEPFDAFLTQHGISDLTADPDHDGLSASLEWFLGGDPAVSDPGLLPKGTFSAPGTFTFRFRRLANLGSATGSVQSAKRLNDWVAAVHGTGGVTIAEEPAVEGFVPVVVTFTGTTAPFFARLMVLTPD